MQRSSSTLHLPAAAGCAAAADRNHLSSGPANLTRQSHQLLLKHTCPAAQCCMFTGTDRIAKNRAGGDGHAPPQTQTLRSDSGAKRTTKIPFFLFRRTTDQKRRLSFCCCCHKNIGYLNVKNVSRQVVVAAGHHSRSFVRSLSETWLPWPTLFFAAPHVPRHPVPLPARKLHTLGTRRANTSAFNFGPNHGEKLRKSHFFTTLVPVHSQRTTLTD